MSQYVLGMLAKSGLISVIPVSCYDISDVQIFSSMNLVV